LLNNSSNADEIIKSSTEENFSKKFNEKTDLKKWLNKSIRVEREGLD
jgi:hypothetical protein